MQRSVTGLAVGGLATSLLLAVSTLSSWGAKVSTLPNSVFEALTRVLPGRAVIFGLESALGLLASLGLSVDRTGKTAESVMAAWSMVIVGAIVTAVLFAAVSPHSRPVAYRWSVGVGLLAATLVLPAVAYYGGGTAPRFVSVVWLLLIFTGWGYVVGWMWAWTESLPAAGARDDAAGESGAGRAPAVSEAMGAPGPAPVSLGRVPESSVEVLSRRRFLVRVGGAAATVTVLGAGVASVLAAEQRTNRPAPPPAVPLPNAGSPFVPAPGTRPEYTPVTDHYRVDIDISPPSVNGGSWRLRIGGLVEQPANLTLHQLRTDASPSATCSSRCRASPTPLEGRSSARRCGRASVSPTSSRVWEPSRGPATPGWVPQMGSSR